MKYLKQTEDLALWMEQLAAYQEALTQMATKIGGLYPVIKNTFHDYRLQELTLEESNQEDRAVTLKMTLTGFTIQRTLKFVGIKKFEVSYEAAQYYFVDEDGRKSGKVTDDGFGDVAVDELIELEDGSLCYEFQMVSGMNVLIICEEFSEG